MAVVDLLGRTLRLFRYISSSRASFGKYTAPILSYQVRFPTYRIYVSLNPQFTQSQLLEAVYVYIALILAEIDIRAVTVHSISICTPYIVVDDYTLV